MTRVINLGCGNRIMDGAINHDLMAHRPEIDLTFDLNTLAFPFPADTFDKVIMLSVIEHLIPNPIEVLNAIWRIVKPEGVLEIKYPLATSPTIHDDPTHRWFLSARAFDYFDPHTPHGFSYGFYTERKWVIINKKQHKNLAMWLTLQKKVG